MADKTVRYTPEFRRQMVDDAREGRFEQRMLHFVGDCFESTPQYLEGHRIDGVVTSLLAS